jgi:integrase
MLTDKACKAAACSSGKHRERYTDAEGLYLEVAATGSKRWFWKYYFGGKEKRLAIGHYPETSLKQARNARDAARRLQQVGTDPVQQRQVDRIAKTMAAETSFEAVAREFQRIKSPQWSAAHAQRWLERLEKDVFPWLGRLALDDVTAPLLLQTLRRVEARGVRETVHSIHQSCGQVFRYGIATGRCRQNPAPDLRGALQPVLVKHQAAILDPEQAGELLRAIHDYRGAPTTRVALALSAMLFQRPGNIRTMEWSELDFEQAMWTIPAAKMKRAWHGKVNGRPHLVPLAPQAIASLNELRPLSGHGRYVFPGLQSHDRPMSENTVNVALRRLGYDKETATAHGFRAMARTLMVERLGLNPDVIEAQLAHGKSGPLGAAYDRADYLQQRREMMRTWADYLDRLENPKGPNAGAASKRG